MLFENLRNVKKKWKVPALIVIIVLILGLLSSFAYLGSSFGSGTNTAATGTSIESLESQAKEAAKAADDSDDGETVIAASEAYYDLAVYQQLYNEGADAKESYQLMKNYAEKALDIYGSVETTDAQWQTAYLLLMQADAAGNDVESLRAHFADSLNVTVPSSDYLQTYANLLYTAEDYQAIVDDMNAAVAVLEPLATNEEETEEETAAEEEETTDDTATSTEETPSDVLATANQLITTAQSLLDDSGTSGAESEE